MFRFLKPALIVCLTVFATTPVLAQSNRPFGSTDIDQSAFAMGSMVWNVIFVEDSTAPVESWTAAEITNVQNKISDSAAYWEGLTSGYHANARLNIDIHYANGGNPIGVSQEPTANRGEGWVNDAMAAVGHANSVSRFTNVRAYNNAQRDAMNTNWAATVFIMDNTSAGLDSYAYAYLGGPFTILTHNPAGWTPDNFNMVTSHEFGHIFNALDEYAGAGTRVTDRGGYLNVTADNASRDANGNVITPPQPNALMRNNGNFNTHVEYAPSESASAMFGHRDTDGDTIPDILDTNPILNGFDMGSNTTTGEFVFSGTTTVNPMDNNNPLNVGFSNSQNSMTINTITQGYYTLNGGAPIAFGATDGSYGGYTENLGFNLTGLTGDNTINVFTRNSVDNDSNMLSFSFSSSLAVPEPGSLLLLLGVSGTLIRRRKS
ncbi:MAG: PEP-CTERM sorting domain-containing protein [Planctomycetota bacterium]